MKSLPFSVGTSKFLLIFAVFAGLAENVYGHGRLSTPRTRDQQLGRAVHQQNAPVPFTSQQVCRDLEPQIPETTLVAGSSIKTTFTYEAPHPGDCFYYLSYDTNSEPTKMQWFKIAQIRDCHLLSDYELTIPDWIPSSDHAVLRWEWYGLQQVYNVEIYVQCVDVKIVGSSTGVLGQPMVTIPGHLPPDNLNGKEYRFVYQPNAPFFFTGPELAKPAGSTGATTPPRFTTTVAPRPSTTTTTAPPPSGISNQVAGILRLELWDAEKDSKIQSLTSTENLLEYSIYPKVTIVAITCPKDVGSVEFLLNGKGFRIENASPYVMTEVTAAEIKSLILSPGSQEITAIAFSEVNKGGVEINRVSTKIFVVPRTVAPPPTTSSPPSIPEVIFSESNKAVIIESESVQYLPLGWSFQSTDPKHTGRGYLVWTGGDKPFASSDNSLKYKIEVHSPGVWNCRFRMRRDPIAGISGVHDFNDVWVRIDGGVWYKVFNLNPYSEWGWITKFDWLSTEFKGQENAWYSLTAGSHTLEIAGMSNQVKIDRIHLYLDKNPEDTAAEMKLAQ